MILSAQVPTIGATLSGWFAKGRPQNCPNLNPDHVGVGIMGKNIQKLGKPSIAWLSLNFEI